LSEIKKTPTDEVMSKYLYEIETAQKKTETSEEDFSRILEKSILGLTPAKKVFFLYHDSEQERRFFALDLKNRSTVALTVERKGLIARSLDTGQPFYTNDVGREPGYIDTADNPFGYDLKSLLLLPRFDASGRPSFLVWAAIPHKNLNQFIREDIEHLETLFQKAEPFLWNILSSDGSPPSRTDDPSTTDIVEDSDSRQDIGSPVLIQVIRSWFHRKKK